MRKDDIKKKREGIDPKTPTKVDYISPAYRSTMMFIAATTISMAMRTITARQNRGRVSNGFKIKHVQRGKREEKKYLTNPFQLLSMTVTQLVLQHGEQIRNDVQPLGQETDALVHLEIAPDGLVDGLELGLDPEELGRVEDGAVEVDVNAQDEELADLHVDLRAAEGDFTREGDLGGDVFAGFDC